MEPAFVIISYDSVPAVRDCIRTARRSFPQSEIVVVDQSFDRCVRTICDEFSDIKLLEATAGRTIEWLVDVGRQSLRTTNYPVVIHVSRRFGVRTVYRKDQIWRLS